MVDSATGAAPAGSWWDGVRRALRLRPARPAYGLAVAVLLWATAFSVCGALFHAWSEVGVAYLAVACAAVFMAGSLRTRVVTLMTQCAGAMVGLCLGAAAGDSGAAGIVVPTVVAVVAGAVGVIGPAVTAAALMAVIGLAFAQFSGSPLPWWQLCLWYGIGTAAMAVPWTVALFLYGPKQDRILIADVFDRAADLLDVTGTRPASLRRAELAAASARCREALQDHLLRRAPFREDYAAAVTAALDAARVYATDAPVSAGQVTALRARADKIRQSATQPRTVPASRPPPRSVRARNALAVIVEPAAWRAGLRLGLCMGAASAVAQFLHGHSHSFWVPLTVAVVVRPEYGSVFGRIVNRVAGTAAGALLAAGTLSLWPTGLPVAMIAAAALGGGLLYCRYSYSFSVAGATTSALLSSCISSPDPLIPAIRLLDTGVGCVLALVLGYLVWPNQRRGTDSTHSGPAIAAATTYLDQLVRCGSVPAAVRDIAYRTAHHLAAQTLATVDEPPPAGTRAAVLLPQVLELDHLIDEISALATPPDPATVARIRTRLDELAAAGPR